MFFRIFFVECLEDRNLKIVVLPRKSDDFQDLSPVLKKSLNHYFTFPTSIKDVSKHREKRCLFVNKNEPKRRWHKKLQNTLPETLPDATFLVTSAPGASKIIQIVIPQMSVVGFGATKMVPQGTISLFRGLCEPFLYAKFRNFDAFK